MGLPRGQKEGGEGGTSPEKGEGEEEEEGGLQGSLTPPAAPGSEEEGGSRPWRSEREPAQRL